MKTRNVPHMNTKWMTSLQLNKTSPGNTVVLCLLALTVLLVYTTTVPLRSHRTPHVVESLPNDGTLGTFFRTKPDQLCRIAIDAAQSGLAFPNSHEWCPHLKLNVPILCKPCVTPMSSSLNHCRGGRMQCTILDTSTFTNDSPLVRPERSSNEDQSLVDSHAEESHDYTT